MSDAITAAGNFTPAADTNALNLARMVTDGEHLHVPIPGETPIAVARGEDDAAPIHLNRANASELETLPGIGPALAARIVAHREQHGAFQAVEELTEVSGIGPAIIANIGDLVVVD
ncbi:MAG: helix-hairpin-helix domain-containing protein [Bowdeniella nasicola]|nr:helix-hairpin-helix domain-containing protein [Bowdeniella nasicola]